MGGCTYIEDDDEQNNQVIHDRVPGIPRKVELQNGEGLSRDYFTSAGQLYTVGKSSSRSTRCCSYLFQNEFLAPILI